MENNNQQDNDITISAKAEQSVLGSILIDNDTIIEISNILSMDDFNYDAHKAIYKAMFELYTSSKPIDFLTLTNAIKNSVNIEEVGGYEYISKLPSIPDYSSNAVHYAKIVKEKSTLRKLVKASQDIINTAKSGKSVENVLDEAEHTIFNISQEKTKSTLHHIKDVLTDTYSVIEQNYKNKGSMTGITTGFIDLNHITNGWQKTDLILVAARPATGKTAFALNLAHNASKDGKKVAVFSLEMSETQLAQRILSAESKVELKKLKTGELEEEDWQKLINAISVMTKYPIYINDTAGINLLEIRSECRKLKMQKGLDMIVIDYLQLMESEVRTESRQQEISKISRGLKILAKELGCPIIALSQLSRAPEQRTNHRPMLSDLRESGAIEQDADIVMFLYRDEIYNPDTDKKNVTEVILAKHRSGEIGTVELAWHGKYQLFLSLETY
ncbi:replicative DNA helicase [Peptoanaerobacter stomatis]|uniref:Replicative DNA helicase n=1 Tax=Peptoanaerobacter stomatis TaxID=796937 RepID=J4WI30_9FIRM|nr:replicative DNA helicase [Peptoanaerobacter stomatis]EJU24746.1 replicative DNA helicase [Peptoanaerobacter stomatis]